jgi:hypothetical protein
MFFKNKPKQECYVIYIYQLSGLMRSEWCALFIHLQHDVFLNSCPIDSTTLYPQYYLYSMALLSS